jgi:hypothetical protein
MAENESMSSWSWWKRVLTLLLQLGGWFAAWFIVSLPVPDEIATFPRFVVVGTLPLVWLVMNKFPRSWRWRLAIAALVIGTELGTAFLAGSPLWIATSKGHRYFRGTLTLSAQEYLRKHPSETEEDYLEGSRRNPDLVWTTSSRKSNRLLVVELYSHAVFFFTFGLFGAIEVFGQAPQSKLKVANKEG